MHPSLARLARNATRLSRLPTVDCPFTGLRLLNEAMLNKGSAFTMAEREEFDLTGLLPPAVNTLEEQVARAYSQYSNCPTPLSKHVFTESMKVQNEVLYYRMIREHLKEMFSVIYTPTAGEFIENYSQLFRKPEGCFLDINHPDQMEERLRQYGGSEDIDYIVVTDSEGILGIGDQGVGGIGISIAKLVLMTVCAGIDPGRSIPVVLDVGTNNPEKLRDPMYLGNRMKRVRGPEYDHFIEKFVSTVKKIYPKAILHFEDFGTKNAFDILRNYGNKFSCFNDDIQGTGAVTVSALTAATKSLDDDLLNSKILLFGAGSAGTGIANQIVDYFRVKGKTEEEACSRMWLMDRQGLLMTSMMDELNEGQKRFAVGDENWQGVNTTSLLEVVKNVKPTILIGCSTQPGAFTEEIVKEMAKHVEHPIIFPLSNPTRLHEATPNDVLKWTDGKAIVATGSPFEPVDGHVISENNNCFIFPGIGLGGVLSRANRITKGMIAAAIDALVAQSPILIDPKAGVLPDISEINEISARVAAAVVLKALEEGVAEVEKEEQIYSHDRVTVPRDYSSCLQWVKNQMWIPEYRPLRKVSEHIY